MNVLRDVSGMAVLTLEDGREVEGFGTLTVVHSGGMKSARGTFKCGMTEAFAAMNSSKALPIAFQDGIQADVIVTSSGMDGLTFTCTGPVRGL